MEKNVCELDESRHHIHPALHTNDLRILCIFVDAKLHILYKYVRLIVYESGSVAVQRLGGSDGLNGLLLIYLEVSTMAHVQH